MHVTPETRRAMARATFEAAILRARSNPPAAFVIRPLRPPFATRVRRRNSGRAALVAVALAIGCMTPPEPTVRVGLAVWPGYEPAFLARELGYIDSTTIELVDFRSPTESLRAYRHGVIDVVATTLDYALELSAHDSTNRVILVLDVSHGGDAIVARREFRSLRELRGSRVGVDASSLANYMLARALEMNGLTLRDVELVPLSITDQAEALADGRVSAVVTHEPTRTQLVRAGARTLFDSRRIPGEMVDVLVARRALVDARPEVLRSLADAWFRARDYLYAEPADAARRVASREAVTPDQFLQSLRGLRLPDAAENRRLLSSQDSALHRVTRQLEAVMHRARLLPAGAHGLAMFDASVLPEPDPASARSSAPDESPTAYVGSTVRNAGKRR